MKLQRAARTQAEREWDEWWFHAMQWYLAPWWKRLFMKRPRLRGWSHTI